MVLNKMEVYRAPVNVWNKDSIRPGAVGSVGDVLQGVRLKQSCIELPMRFDPVFSGKNIVHFGSNVSDGMHAGYTTGGGVARTLTKRMPYRQGFKTPVGWIKEDIVPVERSRTALMGSVGQYSWESKVGKINRAKTTGEFFKPLPNGYSLGEGVTPRGSQIPRIVAESTGEGNALPPTEVKITDPVFGENGSVIAPGGDQPRKGWRKEYLYPNVIWMPEGKGENDKVDSEYQYYVSGVTGYYYPKNDPSIEQTVWYRGKQPNEKVTERFGSDGVKDRPKVFMDKPVPEAPFKWVNDVPQPNTPVGNPIPRPGGWRGDIPAPYPQFPPKKTPTKFMGVNSKRIRIR